MFGKWTYFCMDCDHELTRSQVYHSNSICPFCKAENQNYYYNFEGNYKKRSDVYHRCEKVKDTSTWRERMPWLFFGYILGFLTGLTAYLIG